MPMPTTALYHWSVAGSPVNILLDLPLVDRLRAACGHPGAEVGGILVGHFDGNYTVITDFETIDSEHRRGTAYSLSSRDEVRLGARIEARSKHHRGEVVGFFRSHLRPGMFLDEGDNQIVSGHFSDPRQAVLLVKPASDGTATGGFFFWEDGEMNRKQTYLPFPMNAGELEKGDFPLVEPVGDTGYGPNTANFDTAETVDRASAAATAASLDSLETHAGVSMPARPASVVTAEIRPAARKRNWPAFAMIAAGAALGGYIVGTSGSNHDRFGSRAGDITVGGDESPAPSSAQPATPATKAPQSVPLEKRASLQSAPPTFTPPPPVDDDRPSPMPAMKAPPAPAPAIPPAAPPQTALAQTTPVLSAKPEIAPAPPLAASNQAGWSHFGNNGYGNNGAAAAPPSTALPTTSAAPARTPAQTPVPPPTSGDGSVYLESVEDGGFRQALHHIPLLGHSHSGDDFVPPQAIRSFAPKLPADIARGLTSSQPVDLKLKVDNTGRVTSVELLSRGTPADFVRLAGDAAYDWQFEPARLKDKPVSSEVIAHFRFHAAY
jgi:hypothetical protein